MMKFNRVLSILAVVGLAFAGPAFAQGKAPASKDNTQQLMQTYRQKTQELQGIQQKTVKNNPKLQAQIKSFQDEMKASMKTHGYDVDQGQKRVQAIVAKLKSGKKMSKDERTSAMKSFESERSKMMKARSATMQDPKIQKDRQSLEDNMIAAMKKQDSRTPQLLKDVKSLRAKIMAAMAARSASAKKG